MSKKAVLEPTRPAVPPSDTPVPPAYFLSVSVENFRCFGEKQTLDLSDGNGSPKFWTIILGDNGVGKTTLLQIMAMLRPLTDRYSSDSFNEVAGPVPAAFIYDYNSSATPRPDVNNLTKGFSIARLSAGVFLASQSNGLTEKIELDITVQHGIRSITPKNVIVNGTKGLICYGYGASRRPGLPAIRDEEDQDICASLFDANAELVNPVEGLLQADYAASKGYERAQKRLQTIKDVFIGLLPDVEDLKFEPLNDETDLPTAQAKTPYGWVPVRSLSLGYQSMMTWTLDLASRLFARYPDKENPLAEPAVVLVDEIDLHLHPKWQRTLIQFLTDTFPKTQFIVTAHSPLVVQAAPEANIVVLRREGTHVVIDNDVEIVAGWRADQILTSGLFGLTSARPPELDVMIDERNAILAKANLTEVDEVRLKELGKQIGSLPTGESSEDIEAMNIIRRAAKLLNARASNGQ